MTPEFKAQWIAALRSGKYEQGKGRLREGDKFCCLGVACDLTDPDAWNDKGGWGAQDNYDIVLPFIDIREGDWLAALNDGGTTFAEIADFIERSRVI